MVVGGEQQISIHCAFAATPTQRLASLPLGARNPLPNHNKTRRTSGERAALSDARGPALKNSSAGRLRPVRFLAAFAVFPARALTGTRGLPGINLLLPAMRVS